MSWLEEKEDVFDRLEDISYVPVIGGSIVSFTRPEMNLPNGKNLSFASNNSIFNCKTFLINPYHNKKDFPKLIMDNEIASDSIIFADSGGLQEIRLKGTPDTPEEVMKWQQKYSNIGFSLDKIPFKTDTGSDFSTWTFDSVNLDKYAIQSKERIRRALSVRTEYKKFKFYAIIQGTNYGEYVRWKNIIDQPGIDGWCCKTPTNDPCNLAETALYALENLDKPIHFLGVGNLSKSIILFYLKKYFKHKISFDSSSYDVGSQYRRFNSPFAFNLFDSIKSEEENSINKTNFCFCPACKELREILDKKELERYIGPLISIHNVGIANMTFNYLKQIYKDKAKMIDFINVTFKESGRKKIIMILDLIDDSYKHGFNEAIKKYKNLIKEFKKTTKQATLF